MAIVVEDGTGLALADAYVSIAEADEYFADVLVYTTTWSAYSDADKELRIRRATKVLDSRTDWEGYKNVDTSGLRWPRKHVRDRDGILVSNLVVPEAVKDATCELIRIMDGEDITTGQDIESLRRLMVDVVEIEYQEGRSQARVPQYLNYVLRGLGYFMSGSVGFGRIRKA